MVISLLILLGSVGAAVQDAPPPRVWSSEEVTFVERPRPDFPERASVDRGEAAAVCVVTAQGGFSSCRIESESPAGNGFGRAALVAMRRGARIEMRPEGPAAGDQVRGVLRFRNGR